MMRNVDFKECMTCPNCQSEDDSTYFDYVPTGLGDEVYICNKCGEIFIVEFGQRTIYATQSASKCIEDEKKEILDLIDYEKSKDKPSEIQIQFLMDDLADIDRLSKSILGDAE